MLALAACTSSSLVAQVAERGADDLLANAQYDRPSLTLISTGLNSNLANAFADACSDLCSALSIGSRFDFNDLLSPGSAPNLISLWDTAQSGFIDGADDVVLEALAEGGIARNTILHLYGAEEEFEWGVERLVQRSLYGVSTTDAIGTISAERGVTGDLPTELVPHTYFLVLSAVDYEEEAEQSDDGTLSVRATARPIGMLFRIGYETRAEVGVALTPFFCNEECTGAERDGKRAAFSDFAPAMDFIGYVGRSSFGAGGSREQARLTLAVAMIDVLVDDMVRLEPRLRARSPVVQIAPIAARIGLKEGVKRGRRYFAFERTEDAAGEVQMQRSGVVRASVVADNRQRVFTGDTPGQQSLTSMDSTLFKQIQGGAIRRFHILEERPDLGIALLVGSAREGIYGGWVRSEVRLNTIPVGFFGDVVPLGLRLFIDGALGWEGKKELPVDDLMGYRPDLMYWRANAGLGNEFYLLRGNLRFGVEGSVGLINVTDFQVSTDITRTWSSLNGKGGATLAFAFTPVVDLVLSANYTAAVGNLVMTTQKGDEESTSEELNWAWGDYLDSGTGLSFGVGLRFAF